MNVPVGVGEVADHSYVRVAGAATAERVLVVVPGLNDPLKRVGDARWFAGLMALYLRRYRDTHTVYMVSRPRGLAGARTTATMAEGYAPVLESLAAAESVAGSDADGDGSDAPGVDVLGLSLGGFVVQHLAASHPELVDRVVLGLAGTELSAHGRAFLGRWREHADAGRWRAIYTEAYDVVARGLTARTLQSIAVLYDLVQTPAAPADFAASIDASLAHDGRSVLGDVAAPTLVLGGTDDPFFTEESFRDAARRLPDGRLALLRGAGHEAVVEHPAAFDGTIQRFFARTV